MCWKASREAVLNRSLELTDARQHTFHNTTAVYDLLTIALVKRAQFAMLSEVNWRVYCSALVSVCLSVCLSADLCKKVSK